MRGSARINAGSAIRQPKRLAALATAILASLAFSSSAQAYVGASFLQIPGLTGGWKGAQYHNWVRVDANYWNGQVNPFGSLRRGATYYSGPAGPKSSAGKLVVALDKDNPAMRKMMELCGRKASLAEISYAENSEFTRAPMQIGPRPSSIPEFFEYKLSDVQVAECPVVAEAPQQAFVLTFKNVTRSNYQGDGDTVTFPAPKREDLIPLGQQVAGRSKTFVMTWFAAAHDVSDDQCPVMNKKPTEADYYRLMAPELAAKERAENAKNGGVNYENGQMGYRGPNKLDVMRLPGIVADPGNAAPVTKTARGFDLDNSGAPRKGRNARLTYAAEDGRGFVDNGLYAAQGCIQSFQGRKGFILQFSNNQMHDGMMSMLVEIAGIDNDRNDHNVMVRLSYSLDPMAKSADGSLILADYSFRLTDKPQYTYYFTTFPAKIVDGVITSQTLDHMALNLGAFGTPNELKLWNARIALKIGEDGKLRGVLGGYMDWRPLISRYITSTVENIHGFQVPGLFNALRRYADGLPDPVTGRLNGISSAYDIEGVPIFLGEPSHQNLAAAATIPANGGATAK